jgi:hypothetical protein
MIFVISISLKVVSIAAVFWEFFNLSEILILILLIGTLVSVLSPVTLGTEALGLAFGAGVTAFGAATGALGVSTLVYFWGAAFVY